MSFPEQHHVLVVDDQAANDEIVKKRLEHRGFRVSTAESAEAVFAAIEAERPDLVLLDIASPHVSGLEVLEQLRAGPSTSGIPVILISASADTGDIVRGLQNGANDYVTKPIDMSVLLSRIETHVSGAAMLKASERRAELLMRLAQRDSDQVRQLRQPDRVASPEARAKVKREAKTEWDREPTVDLTAPLRETATSEYVAVDDGTAESEVRDRQRSLFYLLDTEVAKCLSNHTELSLLVWRSHQVDELTEKHGRAIGVELLGKLVDRVSAALEPGAVLCSYQSPAFCIILGGAGLADAAAVAERVIETVATEPFGTEIGDVILSCDVGVATFDAREENSPLEVVERAMCALDQARSNTRASIWLARAGGLMTPHNG